MKITIEVEILPDEVPLATELLATLRSITDHVKSAPPVVKEPKDLLRSLVAKLKDPSKLTSVATDIGRILESYPTKDAAITDLTDAFEAVVFAPEHVTAQTPLAPYLELLNHKLPAAFDQDFRRKVIQRVLAHMTKKRPIDADRTEFILQADVFAHLVKLECVQLEGAMQTVEKLVAKPDNRSAALCMLGKTLDLCIDKLLLMPRDDKHMVPLGKLWAAVDKVTEPVFHYDLAFINECRANINQRHGLAPAGAPTVPVPQPVPSGAGSNGGMAPAPAPAVPIPQPVPVPQPVPIPQPVSQPMRGIVHSPRALPLQQTGALCVAWDPNSRRTLAAYKDSTIKIFDGTSKLLASVPVPGIFMVGTDMLPRTSTGVCAGVSTTPAAADSTPSPDPAVITLFDMVNPGTIKASLPLSHKKVLTTVRALPNTCSIEGFVTAQGERVGSPTFELSVWDASSFSSTATPFRMYSEGQPVITTICSSAAHRDTFLTGSQDGTMRLYDLRAPACVAMFGALDGAGVRRAHEGHMLLSIDAQGDTIVTTGADSKINFFDMRRLSDPGQGEAFQGRVASWDASHLVERQGVSILKLAYALSPSPTVCAFSSAQSGLFLLDWTNGLAQPGVMAATNYPDELYVQPGSQPNVSTIPYHDLRWAPGAGPNGTTSLFAVSTHTALVGVFDTI